MNYKDKIENPLNVTLAGNAPAEPESTFSAGSGTGEVPGTKAAPEKKKHRTTGLKVFDAFLYPFLTNFVVFGMSVGATYLTNKGGMKHANGKPVYGRIGQIFHERGNWVANFFKKTGMNHEQADMSKMVFFSFADGTLVAPMVKLLEDRREKISKRIDDALGTTPEDEIAAYKAEPKQSWLSVIGGRLAVASIVVPTAVMLEKKGLNDKMFNKPGQAFGKWMAENPGLSRWFGKTDLKELGRVSTFEMFYTSVCTAGLYVISRFIARNTGKKDGEIRSILDDAAGDFPNAVAVPAKSYAESVKATSRKPVKPAANFTDRAQSVSESIQTTL